MAQLIVKKVDPALLSRPETTTTLSLSTVTGQDAQVQVSNDILRSIFG
jgi:hypothetical protein